MLWIILQDQLKADKALVSLGQTSSNHFCRWKCD